jgi:hypothetical protein
VKTGCPDLRIWDRDGREGNHELKVSEIVSLLVEPTTTSISKGNGEEETSKRMVGRTSSSRRAGKVATQSQKQRRQRFRR